MAEVEKKVVDFMDVENAEPLVEQEPEEEIGGLDDDEKETFTIKVGERTFTLPIEVVQISKLVNTTVEESGGETKEVTISQVPEKIMEVIVEYMNLCNKHNNGKDIVPPEQPLKTKTVLDTAGENRPKEILEFADGLLDRIGKQGVYDLLAACNYMDIHGFLYTMCATVAAQMKGHPLEKVAKILDPNDPETGREKE